MTITEIINKAVEGGYPKKASMIWEVLFLDPLFWQSLGKAMGWKDGNAESAGDGLVFTCPVCKQLSGGRTEWLYHWHRFIDHLAEGGTITGFFEKL